MGQALDQVLSARYRAWPQIGSINVYRSIPGFSHLAGHRDSKPGRGLERVPRAIT